MVQNEVDDAPETGVVLGDVDDSPPGVGWDSCSKPPNQVGLACPGLSYHRHEEHLGLRVEKGGQNVIFRYHDASTGGAHRSAENESRVMGCEEDLVGGVDRVNRDCL